MKKVISTVLLVLMSLSLVACGKNEDEKRNHTAVFPDEIHL